MAGHSGPITGIVTRGGIINEGREAGTGATTLTMKSVGEIASEGREAGKDLMIMVVTEKQKGDEGLRGEDTGIAIGQDLENLGVVKMTKGVPDDLGVARYVTIMVDEKADGVGETANEAGRSYRQGQEIAQERGMFPPTVTNNDGTDIVAVILSNCDAQDQCRMGSLHSRHGSLTLISTHAAAPLRR